MIRQGGRSGAGKPVRTCAKQVAAFDVVKRRVVGRRNHTMGGVNRSVFRKWDSAGTLRVRSEWDNQPIARKTRHARLFG